MPSKDKAKIAAYKKEYSKTEKHKAYQREWRRKHREANREQAREYDRNWYAEHSDRVLDRYFQKKYGLSREQYQKLLESVNNQCQICGRIFDRKNRPHIDHCHNTNVVRGVLCRPCNLAEGHLGTPETAYRLYEYMSRNSLFYPNGQSVTDA